MSVLQYKLEYYTMPTASRYSPDFYRKVKAELEKEMDRPDLVAIDDIQYAIQDICETVDAVYSVDKVEASPDKAVLDIIITLNPYGNQPMRLKFKYKPDLTKLISDDANLLMKSFY